MAREDLRVGIHSPELASLMIGQAARIRSCLGCSLEEKIFVKNVQEPLKQSSRLSLECPSHS